MTETEWLACEAPRRMLRFLQGRVSDRKLRLFACAATRGRLDVARQRGVAGGGEETELEVAFRYADGRATEAERQAAASPLGVCQRCAAGAVNMALALDHSPQAQAALLREIAGNPFRPVGSERARRRPGDKRGLESEPARLRKVRPAERVAATAVAAADAGERLSGTPAAAPGRAGAWGHEAPGPADRLDAWLTPTVRALAETAYDVRDWTLLQVLADALEEAGCDSADLLGHLRSPGPHVCGCWAVDLVLGKE